MGIKHTKIHQAHCVLTVGFFHIEKFQEESIFNEYKTTIVYFITFYTFLFPKFLLKISDDLQHGYIKGPYTFLQYSI